MNITTFSIWWNGLGGSPSVTDRIDILTEFADVTVVTSAGAADPTSEARPYGSASSLTLEIPASRISQRPTLLRAWRRLLGFSPAYPARRALRRCGGSLQGTIAGADLLEVHSASLVDLALIPELRRINNAAPVVVFCHDVLSDPNGVWVGLEGRGLSRWVQLRRVALQRRRERSLLNQAQLVTVHHGRDRQLLVDMGVTTPIEVVFPPFEVPAATGPSADERVLFVGNLSRAVNEVGARWFLDHCWPLVREARPDARLTIAGIGTPKDAFAASTPGLEVVGPFDDPDALYSSARVVIAPLLRGAGIKYKVLEAMVRAIPVVATPVAATGIVETIGVDPFGRITDEPREFAERVIDLLGSHDDARSVGANGRQAVVDLVDRNTAARRVRDLYQGTMLATPSR